MENSNFVTVMPAIRNIAFVLLLLLPLAGEAQIGKRFVKSLDDAFHTNPKLVLGFDTRRSFFSNTDVKITGIRAGLEFDHRVRFWLGLHFLNTPIYRAFHVSDSLGIPDTIHSKMNFGYLSFITEYVWLRTKRWEASVPLYIGFGNMSFTGFEAGTTKKFGLLELDVQGHYKFFSWIGLGGGVGYRWMLSRDDRLRRNFNNPVYIFKVKLFLGELYKSIFKPDEVNW